MSQPQRSSRNKKIEPLSWEDAAQSPALKGMTSFLDIPAEDIRSGRYSSGTVPAPGFEAVVVGAVLTPGDDTCPVHVEEFSTSPVVMPLAHHFTERSAAYLTTPGDDTHPGHFRGEAAATTPLISELEPCERTPGPLVAPGDETLLGRETVPGRATRWSSDTSLPVAFPMQKVHEMPARVQAPRAHLPRPRAPEVVSVQADSQLEPELNASRGAAPTSSGGAYRPNPTQHTADVSSPGPAQTAAHLRTPGDETLPGDSTSQHNAVNLLTPGRGRSKVRRCVLAQDGHSLGEEAIYQVLWRTGRPESADPNASRTIRIGAADIGYKVNMAKKNVRQNISRLYEKLAIEVLEDFETMSSLARLYRVYSYKQILERRRTVGMEFVLRNKGVVFCTADGAELVASPAYVSYPGDGTFIRPAPPKRRRAPLPPPIAPFVRRPLQNISPEGDNDGADLQLVSAALNRYWPTDQAAAVQLIRDCRRVRGDVSAEEIVFFVSEKLEMSRSNRSITNPTGFIIATVPQSFEGATFTAFRDRMQRQARLAAEEEVRQKDDAARMRNWLSGERLRLEEIVNDSAATEAERDLAERKLRQYATWNP